MIAKVLVVDDDQIQTQALASGLRNEGFEVVVGSESEELISRLEAELPDFVFVNLMKAGTNGLQLSRLIRDRIPSVRVLLTSAYPVSPPQLLRTDCGAVGFVAKPYDLQAIVRILRSRLPLHSGIIAAESPPSSSSHSCAS